MKFRSMIALFSACALFPGVSGAAACGVGLIADLTRATTMAPTDAKYFTQRAIVYLENLSWRWPT